MAKKHRDKGGMALLVVVFIALILLAATALIALRITHAHRLTSIAISEVVLEEACLAGIDYGVKELWTSYLDDNNGEAGNMLSFRDWIDTRIANNEDTNFNGTQDEDEGDVNGSGSFEIADPDMLLTTSGPLVLSGAQVVELAVSRTDDLTGTMLSVRAKAVSGSSERNVRQTIRISGSPFAGFEFAVLTKNINCILCHAEMGALDLARNADPTNYGSFDRIKVATLESLLYRTNQAASNVAGTVYTRGEVMNSSGNQLSAAQIASSQLRGYELDVHGNIVQNPASGAMNNAPLENAALDAEGDLVEFASLYKNYPTDLGAQTDGTVPESFPAPYPDMNENRIIDDTEFAPVIASATGGVTGGIAYGVPEGSVYAGDSLPLSSNGAMGDLSDGTYSGNLILVGTDAQPIELTGKVVIDGDLVVKGPIKGFGQLKARGNVYVVGDVTYADAPGEFGMADDGTENGLALVAGGSIMLGDYLTIRGKSHTKDGSKYPNRSYSIKSRTEHIQSGNITKSGVTEKLDYGYFDPGAVDAGGIEPKMFDLNGNEVKRQGQQYSFTTSELMLFNNIELAKAQADSSYVPRLYGLRESQPNNLFVYDHTDEHSVRYDETTGGVKLVTDYMIENGIDLGLLDSATVQYMNPAADWMSESTLRQIWYEDEMARPRNSPVKFDGLMYSSNAIFALARSYNRHTSHTEGKMNIRGAIISADLGVLVPNGLNLLYDRRVRRMLQLEDPTQVTFRRLAYQRVANELNG